MEGEIKTSTIKREADGWYAVFAVEENQSRFVPKTGQSVGIDVGIESFASLSTGEMISNPRILRESEGELKTAQRRVSRRELGSKRRRKAVKLLAKKHQKIARQRTDFHHKTAHEIVNNFDAIAVEDLKIPGLTKNHHLAKAILDVAWGAFFLILMSKAANAGRLFVKVPAQFTSQDCSQCGKRVRKTLAMREHRCIGCGLVAHRDHNSAIVVKNRGGTAFRDGSGCAPARTENLPVYESEAVAL